MKIYRKISFTAKAIIILIMLAVSSSVSGQNTQSQKLSKGFKVDNTTIVDINNKYGDVSVETWPYDSVWVDIHYSVSDKNTMRLEQKFSEINFELTHTGHYVVINTIISSNRNRLIKELIKLKENIGMGESQVNINIKVKMPDNLDLRVNNKYGNFYINNYNGNISVNMDNGRLKANNLTGYTILKLNFVDAVINQIDTGNLEINYSDLNLASARKIRTVSKTSNITITEVHELFVNSTRDDYHIRMLYDLESQANWSDFEIDDFSKSSNIKMKYGELSIDNIRPSAQNIEIEAQSTIINLLFDKDADMNFEITTDQNIDIPNEAIIDSTEKVNANESLVRITGRTSNIEKGVPGLIMNTTSATISILKR
jgi:hypothetical protein